MATACKGAGVGVAVDFVVHGPKVGAFRCGHYQWFCCGQRVGFDTSSLDWGSLKSVFTMLKPAFNKVMGQ